MLALTPQRRQTGERILGLTEDPIAVFSWFALWTSAGVACAVHSDITFVIDYVVSTRLAVELLVVATGVFVGLCVGCVVAVIVSRLVRLYVFGTVRHKLTRLNLSE